MSEVGNKATLRKVAGLMEMLDQKQFPSVLDIGDIKAVVDISKYLQEPYEEFYQVTSHPINAGAAAKTSWNIFRVGGLTANGGGVNQMGVGVSQDTGNDPAKDELYNYRLLSVGFALDFSAAGLAAEVAVTGSFNWKFGTSGSDVMAARMALGSPAWYDFPYQNLNISGTQFDADEDQYIYAMNAASSGPGSSATTFPGWIPGFFGCGVDVELTHRARNTAATA